MVENFARLLEKSWYNGDGWFNSGMSLEDKQRTLKSIAYMTTYRGGDRTILDNTLNKLLDPAQNYKLEWGSMQPGVGAYYTSGSGTVTMNRADVPADNLKASASSSWQIVGATPHEINHAIDDVTPSATYDYLSKEYRAYYVDEIAEKGRPMTRAEAVGVWAGLLDSNGIYKGSSTAALADSVQAQKIFDQLSRLTGVSVDAANYQKILKDPGLWSPPFDPTAGSADIGVPSAAVPQGNIDNR